MQKNDTEFNCCQLVSSAVPSSVPIATLTKNTMLSLVPNANPTTTNTPSVLPRLLPSVILTETNMPSVLPSFFSNEDEYAKYSD